MKRKERCTRFLSLPCFLLFSFLCTALEDRYVLLQRSQGQRNTKSAERSKRDSSFSSSSTESHSSISNKIATTTTTRSFSKKKSSKSTKKSSKKMSSSRWSTSLKDKDNEFIPVTHNNDRVGSLDMEDDIDVEDKNQIDAIRTIHVKSASDFTKCLTYKEGAPSLTMEVCTHDDDTMLWQVIPVTSEVFGLRHNSGMCLPQNPENPSEPFDCFIPSGPEEALADSIAGLVDCSSPNIAKVGFLNGAENLRLYQHDCIESNSVVLMTYFNDGPSRIVVWAESILLDLSDATASLKLQADWYFSDI